MEDHRVTCNLTNLLQIGPAEMVVVTDLVAAPVDSGGSEAMGFQDSASVSDHCA
jgi:hypothetical protein